MGHREIIKLHSWQRCDVLPRHTAGARAGAGSRAHLSRAAILAAVAITVAFPGKAQVARPFCDGLDVCQKATNPLALRLRDAWNDPKTSEAARDQIKRLVLLEPDPDWGSIASMHFGVTLVSPEDKPGGTLGRVPPDFEKFWITAKNAVLALLIDPDSAKIEPVSGFAVATFGRMSGYAVCLKVNAKNRYGGYTGGEIYAVVLNANGNALGVDRNLSQYDHHMSAQCLRDLPQLNFVPEPDPGSPGAAPSLASEVQALGELHQRGVLTDSEFAAAKAKLLSGSK